MSRDALFQLGMGSVLLKTSQEEDTLRTHSPGVLTGISHAVATLPRTTVAFLAGLVRADARLRGNSAKALNPPATVPGTF